MCPFYSGLIEADVLLYFSGHIKPIYDDNSNPEGGIPAFDLGPINEWYIDQNYMISRFWVNMLSILGGLQDLMAVKELLLDSLQIMQNIT